MTSCQPTYFQAPAVLIPSVTCSGQFIDKVTGLRDDNGESVSVDVSLASAYSLDESDEMSVYTSSYPDDSQKPGTHLPDACSETSGSGFHAFYTTDADRFYDGAKEFYDKFDTSSWDAYLGLAWHDSRFVNTPCDEYGADWSVSPPCHITWLGQEFCRGKLILDTARSVTDDLTQLGTGDAQYLMLTACSDWFRNLPARKDRRESLYRADRLPSQFFTGRTSWAPRHVD